ncbi:hypothetical protein KUV75_09470 [Qipengyuania gaetbuli]|uniref:hypothetical protein n=1 Tax=Qipengyuania gaetbuli TaxID=266952 RepID=UPI001C99B437|nr:hypothetical protein [Qipengyuania gaetbuli]MBY6015126.1 hypothetical protein [Qipengyuania gaetbuli]
MQIIPTLKPIANMHGEDIIVPIQEDVSICLTLHEATALFMSVSHLVREALEASRYIEPTEAQIIAFPTRTARRA